MKSENKPSRQQLFHNVLIAFFTIKDDKNFSIMIKILLIKDDINCRVNSAVIKMWFCHQSKIKKEVYTIITSWPCPGVDKTPGYLYWHHGMILCTDIEIFQIFLKKVHVIFFLISAYLKQVSPLAPEQARKYLSNHATNIEQFRIFIRIIKII